MKKQYISPKTLAHKSVQDRIYKSVDDAAAEASRLNAGWKWGVDSHCFTEPLAYAWVDEAYNAETREFVGYIVNF